MAASLLLCLIVAIVNSGDSPGSDGRAEGVGGTVQAVPDRAQVQATAFSALLDESISGRDMLRRAIEDIVACRVTGGTRANIVGAVGARRALIEKLDRTDVSGLSGGAAAKTALREALSASLRADQAYLVWFDAAGGACPSESAPSFAAVGSANQQATAAKKAFLQTWNPIATARGMPARSAGSI